MVIEDLGPEPRDYGEVLAYQRRLFDEAVAARREGRETPPDRVILVEHKPVYTLGRHGKEANLLLPEETLRSRGIAVHHIERGGDITFHGPGQLVVYPILDLQRLHLGVKAYIDRLEEAVIRTIGEYGVKGERVEGATGVWIGAGTPGERKICAIGVKCSRFVSMHGLALNVNTDLSFFSAINPCGFVDKGVTSLSRELGGACVDMQELKKKFVGNLNF